MIDFEIPDDLAALRDEIRAFVVDKIVPYERDPRLTRHGPDEDLRTELVGLARDAGLLTFQAPRRFGGPTLPKPTRATAPSASRDDGKATVVINRNLHVENHIDGSKGSTATALEVVRKARDSDFLAGGRTIEMEFIA